MELIRPFERLGKSDAGIAGGKGASLGEMTQAGIPVPPGFVILVDAFEQFLKEADLIQELDAILTTVDKDVMHTVENASEKIQTLIHAAEMPADIAVAIQNSFKSLNAEFVAVRSSATAEDGASAAWAGQLDTYLNTTEEDLLTNVQRCWASLFTPRAIFYRFEKGMHADKVSVAVVVQKMIQSEVSGIAFSVHPVTEDYNQLIIEAGFGLGEAIVSGQVTPDSFVVEKVPHRIVDTNLAYQSKALWRKEDGGNEWRELSEAEGNKPALSDDQVLELSELVLKIESHYMFPCDIEWAFEAGHFFITQSRPITTLQPQSNLDFNVSIRKSEQVPLVLTKIFERERPLMYMLIWHESDRDGLARFTNQKVKNTMQLVPPQGLAGSVWYEGSELAALEDEALGQINADRELRDSMILHTKSQWGKVAPYLKKEKSLESIEELKSFYENLCSFWYAMNTVYFRLPDHENLNPEFARAMADIRDETQQYTPDMSVILVDAVKTLLPEYAEFAHIISPYEAVRLAQEKDEELIRVLETRKNEGAFIFEGTIRPMSELSVTLKQHGLMFESAAQDTEVLTGAIAYKGYAKGIARVITSREQLKDVQEGEILVAALTEPDYVPAMQRAAAFVTDEGGVISHTAIIAREMKKPCVIGTKFATKVFKNGDVVEVDAEKGIVRIIK